MHAYAFYNIKYASICYHMQEYAKNMKKDEWCMQIDAKICIMYRAQVCKLYAANMQSYANYKCLYIYIYIYICNYMDILICNYMHIICIYKHIYAPVAYIWLCEDNACFCIYMHSCHSTLLIRVMMVDVRRAVPSPACSQGNSRVGDANLATPTVARPLTWKPALKLMNSIKRPGP